MITTLPDKTGCYLVDNKEIIESADSAPLNIKGRSVSREEAAKGTIAWSILSSHDISGSGNTGNSGGTTAPRKLHIRFDKLTSHDITYVGIIQTARASGLTRFPMPYVLTNCHNSLCAVGGTINEDDHVFGLTAAKHYGGVYVPPHQAVIHQYARECLATAGGMILGSDSHTRYGALGTMAIGEGGPELVKQLLNQTYDINYPEVVAIYLSGAPRKGVGPQDVALAIIGAVFEKGYVKNKVMEFVGPGVRNLSADFRIGIDVMTTETTCLSSVWTTDDRIREYYTIHERPSDYKELSPGKVAYYDGLVKVELDQIKPMIAMPFHPSNVYEIDELKANLGDILNDTEKRARVSFGEKIDYSLRDKVHNGEFVVEQGVIAGCAGGGFENICAAADILRGHFTGNGNFTLNVYPASTPIYMELIRNGVAADILETGAILKTAFCGPCFGAGDTPSNNAFSIRHSTRNFPNREGSKVQNGQIASVALMDARSIAATAASQGVLTAATDFTGEFKDYAYHYDASIYRNRVFDSKGTADPDTEVKLGPNIKDWPRMSALPENLLLKVVSVIHDPVTTTDELIPSGETSSYRSNPLGLAEFTLSRKDPEYVGLAKEVRALQDAKMAMEDGTSEECPCHAYPPIRGVMQMIRQEYPDAGHDNTGFGSTIYAVKPGDGSAREQAASCQKVLGGWANIAHEYATKRYRSNLINWGMLPFLLDADDSSLPFEKGDYLFFPDIRDAVTARADGITALVIPGSAGDTSGAPKNCDDTSENALRRIRLTLGELTDDERQIILDGCLINYNRNKSS